MALEGVLLIDKPKGPSSFDVIHKIRALSGVKRVGHAGTLDPEASGLLVVCLGAYTKLCGYLSDSAKTYEAVIELGIATDSDDAEGLVVLKSSTEHVQISDIHALSKKFTGTISQVPPRYSAIKIKGQRAYKMARSQVDFTLMPRDVEIFSFEITKTSLPQISIRVHCSKGTYIRALARDMGAHLQVGGYARDIRRIASGGFSIGQSIGLEQLNRDNLASRCLTGPAALGGLKTFAVSFDDYEHIRHGRRISLSAQIDSAIAIAMFEDRPVAIAGKSGQGLQIVRVI